MQAIIETIFHPTYLISVTIMGMLMIKRAQGTNSLYSLESWRSHWLQGIPSTWCPA